MHNLEQEGACDTLSHEWADAGGAGSAEGQILMQLVEAELQMNMARGPNGPEPAAPCLSAEQLAWRRFRAEGVNVRAWAIERGFHPGLVYSVLRGERKCVRGQSHQVAVALGLKPSAS